VHRVSAAAGDIDPTAVRAEIVAKTGKETRRRMGETPLMFSESKRLTCAGVPDADGLNDAKAECDAVDKLVDVAPT
jgi:hypothetical protein